MELLIFGILAVIALAGAAGVVLLKNPVHCAVCLLATFFAVAGMFGVLWAEFLAVVQLLVYTGGIMVLFLFVIMLVDLEQRGLDEARGRVAPKLSVGRRAGYAAAGLLFAAALGAKLLPAVASFGVPADDATRAALQGAGAAKGAVLGNVERVADLLYTSYLLPFELASVVLLVGMVGAVVVARRRA